MLCKFSQQLEISILEIDFFIFLYLVSWPKIFQVQVKKVIYQQQSSYKE